MQWLTANIGIHHIHHMAPKIPNYRLEEALDENPAFQRATKVTLWDGIKTLHLALWDEEGKRLISFRQAGRVV
jgi:omega-6 fatty acid desaturase (delta-12 desaturase)